MNTAGRRSPRAMAPFLALAAMRIDACLWHMAGPDATSRTLQQLWRLIHPEGNAAASTAAGAGAWMGTNAAARHPAMWFLALAVRKLGVLWQRLLALLPSAAAGRPDDAAENVAVALLGGALAVVMFFRRRRQLRGENGNGGGPTPPPPAAP